MAQTRIEYSLGFTRNLGDFNSLRVDIGIAEDRKEDEKLEEAFARVAAYVEKKLFEKVSEVEAQLVEQQAEVRKKR